MPTKKSKTILGIDPGTNVTGYGIIEVCGKTMHCVVLGIIDLHRISDPYAKLRHIFDRVCALIDEYRPDEVALESPFFGQNVQSMLKLGRAQGVSIAAASRTSMTTYHGCDERKSSIDVDGVSARILSAPDSSSALRI